MTITWSSGKSLAAGLATFVLCGSACAPAATNPVPVQSTLVTARIIRADAPSGFDLTRLGMPVDANFQPLVGPNSHSLFPDAGAPVCTEAGDWRSERDFVETADVLAANASAWGVLDAQAQYRAGHQYAFYRALQIARVCSLRQDSPMGPVPAGARYYAAQVELGHSLSVFVHGDSSSFTAAARAEFGTWGVGVSALTSKYHLTEGGLAHGLTPSNGQALFAPPSEVGQHYTARPEAPVPIVVVYRELAVAQSTVPPRAVDIRFTGLQVASSGSWFFNSAYWNLFAQCTVNGQPGAVVQVLSNSKVSPGATPITFSQQVTAGANVECFVWGDHTRADGRNAFSRTSTGLIPTGSVQTPISATFDGGDADAKFTVTWTATPL